MKLSILINTTFDRENYSQRLRDNFLNQLNYSTSGINYTPYSDSYIYCHFNDEVEILFNMDLKVKTIGEKRNELMGKAKGDYVAYFDDDDEPTPIYIKKALEICDSGKDCGSLTGLYYHNGIFDRPFIHSIKYNSWYSDEKAHYRCPNHLNVIKRELVKDIKFEEINAGEDGKWSMKINDLGLLKTEHEVPEVMYHYYHRTK